MEQQQTFAENRRAVMRYLRAARELLAADCDPEPSEDEAAARREASALITQANVALSPPS